MKTLLLILLLTFSFSLSGCATKTCCPREDMVIFVPTPMGLMTIGIEKGHFNKENEDDDYVTLEKYNKLMEEEPEIEEGEKI